MSEATPGTAAFHGRDDPDYWAEAARIAKRYRRQARKARDAQSWDQWNRAYRHALTEQKRSLRMKHANPRSTP